MTTLKITEVQTLVVNDGTGAILTNNGMSNVWITDGVDEHGFIIKPKTSVSELPEGNLYAYTAAGSTSSLTTTDPAIVGNVWSITSDTNRIAIPVTATSTVTIATIPAGLTPTLTATSIYGKVTPVVSGMDIQLTADEFGNDEIVVSDGVNEFKIFTMTINADATGITITNAPADFVDMEVGEPLTITCTVAPANAKQNFSLVVNGNYDISGNVITPLSAGPVVLTAMCNGGFTATQNMTSLQSIESIEAFGIERMPAGKTYDCSYRVLPTDTSDKTAIWTSSDENVATIDEQGFITSIIAGTTTITVTSDDDATVTDSFVLTVV